MPEPRIYKSIRVFRQQLLRGERRAADDLIRYYGNAWQSILTETCRVTEKIEAATKAGQEVSPAWLFQQDRLQTLQYQVEASLNAFAGQASDRVQQEQEEAIRTAQDHAFLGVLDRLEPPSEGSISLTWNRLPEEQTRDLIGTLQDGSPLREIFDTFGPAGSEIARRVLVDGVALGKNPREIARDMRRGMGMLLTRALRISRTEVLRSYRETTRRSYQANSDVVKGWIWHATIDGHTCPMCWAMHGTEHKLEERLNDHPNGRCAMIPRTATWEEITGVPSIPETRPEIPKGEQIFAQQPEVLQRKVLGDAGYEAWKAGKVTLSDFVAETPFDKKWGKHRYSLTLNQAMARRAAPPVPQPPPAPAPPRAPQPPSVPKAEEPTAEELFPDDLVKNLVEVRSLGGTTGAVLMEDPRTGRRYVVKRGASPEHIRSEALADRIYQELGVNVPPMRLYEGPGGPVKVAEFIPNTRSLAELRQTDPTAAHAAEAHLRRDFAADAFLGNWDVIGTGADNILIDETGKVWRIDNGGALDFRAQGQKKSGGLSRHPIELWSMRDPNRARDASDVFGSLSWHDISVQMLGVHDQSEQILSIAKDANPALAGTLENRLDWFRRLGTSSREMSRDGWRESYIDTFCYRRVDLWSQGVFSTMTSSMNSGPQGLEYLLVDSRGRKFDFLRGEGSVSERLWKYMNESGGSADLAAHWANEQAVSSWNALPTAVKAWTLDQRGMSVQTASERARFWWAPDCPASTAFSRLREQRGIWGASTFDNTFATLHAATMEVLSRVSMPGNDPNAGEVILTRTESSTVTRRWGLPAASKDRGMSMDLGVQPRGPMESASLTNTVFVNGEQITLQRVPHHRVFGSYLFNRPGEGGGFFHSDRENEFVVMLDGLRTTWVKGEKNHGDSAFFWRRAGFTK